MSRVDSAIDGSNDIGEVVKKHRTDLEALAKRDDLRVSKYAKTLLEVADARE